MKQTVPLRKIVLQIAFLLGLLFLLSTTAALFAVGYERFVFMPLQQVRCFIFRLLPFSCGDLLYFILSLYLLYRLFRFIKRIRREGRQTLWYGLVYLVRSVLVAYLLLYLFWGIQYEQPKLADRLALPARDSVRNAELISFDSTLVERLNLLQKGFKVYNLHDLNTLAGAAYKKLGYDIRVSAKPTLLGNGLAYSGVEGYFNPFTGEAQVNVYNPDFMQGYVVAHEIAHQTGIAAEDDANLLAYIACVESNNPSLQYSAYFNLWLYTHRRVRRIDSNIANALKVQLNEVSKAQLDTLRQRRIQYQTVLDDMSGAVFDAYLKLGKQKEGIGSYRNVAYSALCWEQKKKREALLQHKQ